MGLMSEVESPHWLQRDTRIAEDDCGAERGLQPGSHPAAHVAAILGCLLLHPQREKPVAHLPPPNNSWARSQREVPGGAPAGGLSGQKVSRAPKGHGFIPGQGHDPGLQVGSQALIQTSVPPPLFSLPSSLALKVNGKNILK